MEKRENAVQSIERAAAILRAFTVDTPELGVTEIGRRVGLHKSTAFRLLRALEKEGLVSKNPETGRYRLGVGLIELAGRVMIYTDVRRAVRPHMRALADKIGATVSLAMLEGDASINLEQLMPRGHMVVNCDWVGRRLPLHATSTGKVLLAWLESEATALLKQPLEAYTPHTITDVETLEAELNTVRRAGYSVEREEYEIGLNAIAAPVCDHTGQVRVTICASGPSYRLSPDNFAAIAEEVMSIAQTASAALGCVVNDVMREQDHILEGG